MRKFLSVLVVGLAAAGAASADMLVFDDINPEVLCHDKRGWRDAGLIVSVETGGVTGFTMARVAEQTIAGPRPLKNSVVEKERTKDNGEVIIYAGPKFRLNVQMEKRDHNGFYEAHLKTVVDSRVVTEPMLCKLFE